MTDACVKPQCYEPSKSLYLGFWLMGAVSFDIELKGSVKYLRVGAFRGKKVRYEG